MEKKTRVQKVFGFINRKYQKWGCVLSVYPKKRKELCPNYKGEDDTYKCTDETQTIYNSHGVRIEEGMDTYTLNATRMHHPYIEIYGLTDEEWKSALEEHLIYTFTANDEVQPYYQFSFKPIERKRKGGFKVYFATEENGYEMSVEVFDTEKEAQNYYDGIEVDLENDDEDYITYLYLCRNKLQCDIAENEITLARKNFIAETMFGTPYEDLDEDEQAETDGEI